MQYTHRLDLAELKSGTPWAESAALAIMAAYPTAPRYTTAAGISPSGVVHFGNFRDVVTAHLVREALRAKGQDARLIFSWDNFDRFRKVPAGVPEAFAEHIGKPLTKVPDPVGGCHASYAEHFQEPFVRAMQLLGIEIEFRDQTALHASGVYDDAILHALSRREQLADILLSFMTEKAKGEKGIDPVVYRENYYPISVYSRFTGTDATKVLSYDGGTKITYRCVVTGNEDTVDITKEHIVKLAWKPDWAMRWRHEQVHFEPGGHDHASPGGSYDTSSVISREVFGYEAPIFVEYKFVGIQGLGSKMSGSKGNAVSPLDLLDIYEPELLKWLYFRKSPDQSFELAFNTEIYRQYDEYDRAHDDPAIPFRQAVGFGQIVQWQEDKLRTMLDGIPLSYSAESIARRLPLARTWLSKYNPEQVIVLREEKDVAFAATLSEQERTQVRQLRDELMRAKDQTVAELEALTYAIPKLSGLGEAELKQLQRAFFKTVYRLLIGAETGPRLGTYLWAADRDRVVELLNI